MTVHSPLLKGRQTSHWQGAILVPNSRLARGNGQYGNYAVCTCLCPPAIVSRVGSQSVMSTKPDHVMFVADRPGALRTV